MPPLIARRLVAAAAVVGFMACAGWLLLVDSSIRYLSLIGELQDVVTRVGRRVEALSGIDALDRSDVPGQEDDYGHALFWGTGMILVGWVTRHRMSIGLAALLLSATSLLFEVLQPIVTMHRATQPTDVVANVTGIALATCVLAVVLMVVRWLAPPSPDLAVVRSDGTTVVR